MNKQLINKYKPEFDHWLNEGKLLCYTEVDGPYYEVTDEKWDFVCDIGFIINDEYVEFRKALAEGKTVQYYVDGFAGWQDVTKVGTHGIIGPSNYRIKPIEFKLGDYVKLTSTTHVATRTYPSWFQIDGKDITLHTDRTVPYINITKGCYIFYLTELELWQPKAGEWCWFWDKPNSKYGTLTKFHSLRGSKFKSDNCTWTYCAPFIGKLPSYLKD